MPDPAIRERFLLRRTRLRRVVEPRCWQEMKRGRPCRIPRSKSHLLLPAHLNAATRRPTVCPTPTSPLSPPDSAASRQENRYSCPQNPARCDETVPAPSRHTPPRQTARSHCECGGSRPTLPERGAALDAPHLAPDAPHRPPSGFRLQRPGPSSLSRLLFRSY